MPAHAGAAATRAAALASRMHAVGAVTLGVAAAATLAGAIAVPAASAAPAAAPASPSFTAPVELSAAPYGLAATAATDAAGTTSAVITGSGAPKLLQRPAGSPWPAATRLPGDPRGAKGPVVAAAGRGALAIAWRVDSPRRYSGIQAEVRDPGGALSTPIVIATEDAGGVRHPAIAVDPAGDALLAYNTETRKNHLSLRGAIAVAYRPATGSFTRPVVIDDQPSEPPAVALAPDGTGIVVWVRAQHVYAVTIADGQLGRVKRIAKASGRSAMAVAAGPGGEATIAWAASRSSHRSYEVRYVRRAAGGAFGTPRVLRSTTAYLSDLALATDEGGRATVAWTEERSGSSGGQNGLTSFVRAASAATGHDFGTPRVLAAGGQRYRQSLSIAAANGRVALAWGYKRDRRHVGVEATVGRATALAPPQTVASSALSGRFYVTPPDTQVTLDPTGAATVLAVLPSQPAPDRIASRLVAIDGR